MKHPFKLSDILFTTALLFLLAGCGGHPNEKSTNVAESKAPKAAAAPSMTDTIPVMDEADLTPSQAEERENYKATYNDIIKLDTVFNNGTERVQLHATYYCLKDSDLVIPKRYDWGDKPKEFTTHPFVTDVVLVHGNDTVLNKKFMAKDFRPFDDPFEGGLTKYGDLMPPTLSRRSTADNIIISYSLTIPVTDLGVPAHISFNKNGTYKTSTGH